MKSKFYSLLELKVDTCLFIREVQTYFHCLHLVVWHPERMWSTLQTQAQYEINHWRINITKFPKGNLNNCSKTPELSRLPNSGNKFGWKASDCKVKRWETFWVAPFSHFSIRKCKYSSKVIISPRIKIMCVYCSWPHGGWQNHMCRYM